MKKILVIRFSSIGDIVLTTPVIRCLKNQLKDIELHVLTKKKFSSLYKSNPYIDKVFEFDSSLKDNIKDLKTENYDYIVDLQKNKRSRRVTSSLALPHSSFPKLNLKKFLLTTFKINLMPDIHIVDRYFEAVKELGVNNDLQGLDFFISEDNRFDVSILPIEFQKGFHAIVIGGTYKTKILPAVKVIEVIKKLQEPVVLLGGPDDVERAEEILSSINRVGSEQDRTMMAVSLAGKISLQKSASVVEQAKSVLTNDTGLMHIAAAFHKNIISVWGNTVPELGMYPYLPKEAEKCHIIECKSIKCRPCSKLGFKECPKRHFRCMMEIDTDAIVSKMKIDKND